MSFTQTSEPPMRPTQPFKSMRVAPAAIAITSLVTVAASKSCFRAGESPTVRGDCSANLGSHR